jgi:hypothetical protein
MTDMPKRMIQAALDAYSDNEWRTSASAMKAAITAALDEAEKDGIVLVQVPPPPEPRYQHHTVCHTVWCEGYVAAIADMLAGEVKL